MSGELFGYLSAMCLAFCALPQALHAVRVGHAKGLDPWFLGLWTVGEIFGTIYIVGWVQDIPLLLNYIFNTSLCLLLCWYKYIGEKRKNV